MKIFSHKQKCFLGIFIIYSSLGNIAYGFGGSTNIFKKGFGQPPETTTTRSFGRSTGSSGPYGVEKSSMSPIPVTVENLSDISSSVSTAIVNGYTYSSDALVAELYPVLTNALSDGISSIIATIPNPLNTATSIASLTGTPISSPYSANSVVQYNLTDTTKYVYDCITSPITTSVDTYLANSGVQSVFVNQNSYALDVANTNLKNCQNNDNQVTYSSGSTVESAKMNINNLLTSTTANNLTSSTSWASYKILNELTISQLLSAAVSLRIQSGSSSSSGGGNAPNTNVSRYGNVAGNTTVTTSIAQAACMVTNTVYNIISKEMSQLDSYFPGTQITLKKEDPVTYNKLIKIFTSDALSNLKNYYNMSTTNAECLTNANSSSYPSPSTDNAISDLKLVVEILTLANHEIEKIVKRQIATGIIEALGKNYSTNSQSSTNEIPQIYTTTGSADIDTLFSHNSLVGIPNQNSICTLKSDNPSDETVNEKRLAVQASALVNNLSGQTGLPDAIAPTIPFSNDVGAMGGGFGSINNTNNMSSSNASTISTNRTSATNSLNSQVEQYKNLFSGFSSNRSIPTGILTDILYNRQNAITIPTYVDSNGDIMNPAPTSTTSARPGYIPVGEVCTSQEIEHFLASYRLKGKVTKASTGDIEVTTNNWQQGISSQKNNGIIQKEEALLLAEIRYQLYQEQKQLEQELANESIALILNLGSNTKELAQLLTDMDSSVKAYVTGGGQTSSTSSGSMAN